MEYKRRKVSEELDQAGREEMEAVSKKYMDFLSQAKTERLASEYIEEAAKDHGFVDLKTALDKGVKPGDKVYAMNRKKGGALFRIGEDLEEGMDIVGSHIDSPRLDIKPVPVHEAGNIAYLRTHYYGGVKKYHWTNLPLALHGVVYTKEGEEVEINIGEDPDDPVFYINDLLIHLSRKRMKKKGDDIVEGEQLQIVIGHDGAGQDEDVKDPVKQNILKLLEEKYGIEEADFMTAELEAVPAGPAREVGFDRSMIVGHGHDDRVCSYPNLQAILDAEPSKRTAVALFVDKEEVGSMGNTGMHSAFFMDVVAELIHSMKGDYNELYLRRAMANSRVLSADVSPAYDPMFKSDGVFAEDNTAILGGGITLAKYTGSRGKGGSSDASAEYLSEIRQIFDRNHVIWQTGELGAIDAGGGGTIAYILANQGAQVVDCGVAMMSMHAPLELASKFDIYETYKAYKAFMED